MTAGVRVLHSPPMQQVTQPARRTGRRGFALLGLAACFALSGCGAQPGGDGGTRAPAVAPASSAVDEGGFSATLLRVRGTVRYRLEGASSWVEVAESAPLPPRSDVRTLAASVAELQFPDGSVSRIAPESALRVQAYPRRASELRTDLRLYGGEVWQTVQRLDGQATETQVSTAQVIALVRGTGYDVAAGSDGSRVAVAVGEVEVRTASGARTLTKNQGLRATTSGAESFDATDVLHRAWGMENMLSDILLGSELIESAEHPSLPPTARGRAQRTVAQFYTTLPKEQARAYASRSQEYFGAYAFISGRPDFTDPSIDAPSPYRMVEGFEPPTDVPEAPPDFVDGAVRIGTGTLPDTRLPAVDGLLGT